MSRGTFRFGGQWRRVTHNHGQSGNSSGTFAFDNVFINANPFVPAGTGNAFASFLLGKASSGNVTKAVNWRSRILRNAFRATFRTRADFGARVSVSPTASPTRQCCAPATG
jgi:hypothetical protein